MTAAKRITIDDLKDKAEAIKDTVTEDVRVLTHEKATQAIIVGAVAVAVVASFAFYMGTRRYRRR